ncbi:MAG: SDR family oxidoreductase [Rhodospirillales bacterium]|nr:SDR family oxidoreductase [Rhodospirillales bacterium]
MSDDCVLVTGVSRGIGKAIAARLAADGRQVIGISRTKPDNFPGHFYAADLADPVAAKSTLARIVGAHRILRLANNAGLIEPAAIEDVTDAQFEATMRLNVQTAIWAIQAVLPTMKAARFGRIVTIGSRAGLGKATRLIYSTSKAAVLGLTRTAALELARDNITVNTVAPGPIETELFAANTPAGSPQRQSFLKTVPMNRMGTVDEVAAAVSYFLADEAGFTTGQTLYVCGGLSISAPA